MTNLALDKGYLYKRKHRPTIYFKFTPKKGGKPIHLSTGKTSFLAARGAAHAFLETYDGKTASQVKSQTVTIAEFCRLPVNEDPNDRGGQCWQ